MRSNHPQPGPPSDWPVGPLDARDDGVLIRLRVQPNARHNMIRFEDDGRIRVSLTAPPVEGAANKALIRFMARFLGVKRSNVSLASGGRSRDKAILVRGLSPEAARQALASGAG